MNNDFVSWLLANKLCKITQKPIFRYRENDCFISLGKLDNRIVGGQTEVFWEFSDKMIKFLGVGSDLTSRPVVTNPVKIPRKVECFFVYSDLVHPSHIGGKTIDLIDVKPTNESRGKFVQMLHYKDVRKSLIDDISIKITDQNLSLIHI